MALPNDVFLNNVPVPLFIEYDSVAKREGLVDNLTSEEIDSILDYLLHKSKIQKIFFLWRPIIKDPKDDLVLEIAVKSQSKYIVTFNKKDFKGCEKFGIEAITPMEFIREKGILS